MLRLNLQYIPVAPARTSACLSSISLSLRVDVQMCEYNMLSNNFLQSPRVNGPAVTLHGYNFHDLMLQALHCHCPL